MADLDSFWISKGLQTEPKMIKYSKKSGYFYSIQIQFISTIFHFSISLSISHVFSTKLKGERCLKLKLKVIHIPNKGNRSNRKGKIL